MKEKKSLQFIAGDHDHERCIATALANAEQVCQQKSRRFTALRRKVFALIWRRHKPIGAYEVLEHLQREGRTAPPTVYRALDFLLQQGLIHRIASLNAYVGCTHPGEHHQGQFFICESCKAFAELDSAAITAAIDADAQKTGFVVHQHTVEIMGLCPRCREEQPTDGEADA